MTIENPISLLEAAREFQINRSTLQYYIKEGLFVPKMMVGKMMIFEKDELAEKIRLIRGLKKLGSSLQEIKSKLNK